MAHANIKGHFKNTKGQQSSLKRSQDTQDGFSVTASLYYQTFHPVSSTF